MVIELLSGWEFIQASQKRHFFHDGRSLCGRDGRTIRRILLDRQDLDEFIEQSKEIAA